MSAIPSPAVAQTRLYSYLVTRHTGRAVRSGIEQRLAEYEEQVLTVLDLADVPLIDFSCADEVVVKLVSGDGVEALPGRTRYFLLRGVGEHHLAPIVGALSRQQLAIAALRADGEPVVLGSIEPQAARVWRALCQLGRAAAGSLADALETSESSARGTLDELEARRLVLRDGERYVSFTEVLRIAESGNPPA